MISIPKFTKVHNSIKSVGGVMFLTLCKSTDGAFYFYKFHENILDGFKDKERTLWGRGQICCKFLKNVLSVLLL